MKRLQWIWQGDVYLKAVILLAMMASIVSFAYFYSLDTIIAFGDGQARLMMARRVVDGLHTGLAQLGGVWLPIPQILMVPFIWNDFLYSSGIAGAIVSMVSYVVATVFLYKLIVSVTKDRVAGLIGVVAFSSPNILYMQSVPMSEMPFITFFVMSVYFLMRWVQDVEKLRFLFLTALAVFLATLTRYEGWVLFWVVAGVMVYAFWKNHFSYAKVEGYFVFFAVLALFGVGLWFIWNQVIFGDILYFARGEYSARVMINTIVEQMLLSQRTAGNLPLSFLVYGRTALDNTGWIAATVSSLGLVYLLFLRRPFVQKLVVLSLLFPFAFYVFALFEGKTAVIGHPVFIPGTYLNTRYGVFMLPAVGFFVGFLAQKKWSWLKLSILILVVGSSVVTWQVGIISRDDAFKGGRTDPGAQIQRTAGDWLKNNYDSGLVLMENFTNVRVTFTSKLPLREIIYEGDQDMWEGSLQDPTKYVCWVFMRGGAEPDKVWKALHGTPQLLENYDLVYQNGDIEIYRRKPAQ